MLKKEGNGWARGAEDVSEGGKKDGGSGGGGGGGAGSGRNQITPPESDCVCVKAAGQMVKVQQREKLAVASTLRRCTSVR